MTVYKYDLPIDDCVTMMLPRGAQPLCVAIQHGRPVLWARIDPKEPMMVGRRFRVAGTGHPDVSDWPFLGTLMMHSGTLVFHVFVEPE